MLASSTPPKLPTAFAASGLKNTIPATTAGIAQPGQASLDVGFPAVTMAPLASGGIAPFGQDFNGILYSLSAIAQWQQAGGHFTYNSAFSTAIGGYPAGAVLLSTTSGMAWLNTVDGNTTDPDGVSAANWTVVPIGGIANVIVAAALTVSKTDTGQLWQSILRSQTFLDASVSANTITINAPGGLTLPAAMVAFQTFFNFKAANTNTSSTVNVNFGGNGNVRLKRLDGSDPAIGDIVAGRVYPVAHDGTQWRLMSQPHSYTDVILFSKLTSGTVSYTVTQADFTVHLLGGGGAGGGITSRTVGVAGGGSGAYARKRYTNQTIGATMSLTVGAAGAAAGGSGGSSSFNGDFTAGGGGGGTTDSDSYGGGGAASGSYDYAISGAAGFVPVMGAAGAPGYGGPGGNAPGPFGGPGGRPNVSGASAGTLGGGGGGGTNGTGTVSIAAGAGGVGACIITG